MAKVTASQASTTSHSQHAGAGAAEPVGPQQQPAADGPLARPAWAKRGAPAGRTQNTQFAIARAVTPFARQIKIPLNPKIKAVTAMAFVLAAGFPKKFD